MLLAMKTFAQSSFGYSGYWSPNEGSISLMNSFESNPSNHLSLKDWGLIMSYGSEFSSITTSNLYMISLSKRIGDHYLSLRYTPGFQKDFVFNNGQSIVLHDSSVQSLDSKFTYKELFGLGYSYRFTDNLSAGFTLRYFNQEFNQEAVLPVFSDTLYLIRESQVEKANYWRGDLGIFYSPSEELSLSLSSINLIDANENNVDSEVVPYEIKKNKDALFSLSFTPVKQAGLNLLYETGGSFQVGCNTFLDAFGGTIGFGITAFHDRYQSPYFAGIEPAITFSSKMFGVAFSGIKYFSNRNTSYPLSDFLNNGIDNIVNTRYSSDRAFVTFTLTLNTIPDKTIELLDADILTSIYPALTDHYLTKPFATGTVVNLTNSPVTVKPSSKIEGINNDAIESPSVVIGPKDTASISFYTIIPQSFNKEKAGISYVVFNVKTEKSGADASLQKPILVNGINMWDGKVINLRYYIKRDYPFSMDYAKNILSRYKSELDTLSYALSIFYEAKIIFNNFVKDLVYTSNPRAEADYVQFPHETIKLRGGNCDDLSVCYSSLLESVGIQTALVDYKPVNGIGHVNVLVDTQLSPEQARLITNNDSKYFIRKNESGAEEVWIPVETTSLTNFDKAWDIGTQKFNEDAINNLGLAKNTVEIVDVY